MTDSPDREAFAAALQNFDDMRVQRDTAIHDARSWEDHAGIIQNQLDAAREALRQIGHERDYYMRLATELTTQFNTFAAMVRDALDNARAAPYRQNGHAAAFGSAQSGVAPQISEFHESQPAIPEFLTDSDLRAPQAS